MRSLKTGSLEKGSPLCRSRVRAPLPELPKVGSVDLRALDESCRAVLAQCSVWCLISYPPLRPGRDRVGRCRQAGPFESERTARTGPGERQSSYITVERGERESTLGLKKGSMDSARERRWPFPQWRLGSGPDSLPIQSYHPQRLALWSVPTIVKSCRHSGLEATDGQSRPLRRQHFDPSKRSIERAPPGTTPIG
jgi:hypothetical protein